jgi:hypothetical protein
MVLFGFAIFFFLNEKIKEKIEAVIASFFSFKIGVNFIMDNYSAYPNTKESNNIATKALSHQGNKLFLLNKHPDIRTQ